MDKFDVAYCAGDKVFHRTVEAATFEVIEQVLYFYDEEENVIQLFSMFNVISMTALP